MSRNLADYSALIGLFEAVCCGEASPDDSGVTGGYLKAAAAGALSPNSAVNITGGTLDASGFPQTIQSLTMTGGALNPGIGNLLTSTGTAGFAGTLNIYGAPSGGTDELMSYTGYQGSFSLATSFAGYTLTYNATQLDLIQNVTGPATWQYATGGSWNDTSKWTGGTVPSGSGAQAVVGAATTASWTITLDTPQTLAAGDQDVRALVRRPHVGGTGSISNRPAARPARIWPAVGGEIN